MKSDEHALDAAIRAIAAVMAPAVRAKIRLPNVVGVGSGRCGTTYLFGLLSGHPDFYVSPLKEVNYFGVRQAPFIRGGWSLDDYRLCFASQGTEKYITEISPVYIAHPISIQQIAMTLRPVRVLITLREPMARFISHFKFHISRHGFSDINRYAEQALLQYVPGYFDLRWNLPVKAIQLSLYAAGVKTALERVGRENVLVLIYEELARDDTSWRTQLGKFFDTDFSNVAVSDGLRNPSVNDSTSELSPENRAALTSLFAADTSKLSELMGQDFKRLWTDTSPVMSA